MLGLRSRDHADEWRPTLRQFFHIVREFDAHAAHFADRLAAAVVRKGTSLCVGLDPRIDLLPP